MKPYTDWSTFAPITPVFHDGLMPHQTEVVRRACAQRHFLVAHEQGTGKTITGIMLAKSALASGAQQVLVICPPSLTINWRNEFAKWAPEVTTDIIKSRKPLDREGSEYAGLPEVQVIIATDGAFAGYNRWFVGGLQRFTWDDENAFDERGNRIIPEYFQRHYGRGVDALIVDECQRVSSSRGTARSGAYTHFCAERPMVPKWLLSGTPFTKTRVGLYRLAQGLQTFDRHTVNERPADAKDWLDHFAPATGSQGQRGQANCEQLHAEMFHAVTGWAHRVRASDVITDLPDLGRIVRPATLSGEWAKAYRKAETDLEQWLIDTRGHARAEALMRAEALIKVQELRRLVGRAKVASVIERVQETLDTAEEGSPEPVLVLTTHSAVRTEILAHFADAGLRVGTIHGSMTAEDKQAVVDGWQRGDYDVVVANVISASVGFTMTEGRHIVFAELPWNSCDLVQAEARLLRKGQKREVISQVCIGEKSDGGGTIDDRLWGLLRGKFAEAEAVIDGHFDAVLTDESHESIAMQILRSYLSDL